ncbi:MAG: hypothetical protein WCW27_03535 [Patescibacteria group bacterium]|jgi:hypothetical protein
MIWKKITLIFAISTLVILFGVQRGVLAAWQEPTCDPAVDPGAEGCNISAPLNVSEARQTKLGSITAQSGFGLLPYKNTTIDINTLYSYPYAVSAYPDEPYYVTYSNSGDYDYNWYLILPGNSVSDGMVNDDLTSSKFVRGGSTPAVDLNKWANDSSTQAEKNNAEVYGTLPSNAVGISDIWVNTTGDSMSGVLQVNAKNSTGGVIIGNNSDDNGIGIEGSGARYGIVGYGNIAGLYGKNSGTDWNYGVYGEAGGSGFGAAGVYGKSTSSGMGVFGESDSGIGIVGFSNTNYGVYGRSDSTDKAAVYGEGTGDSYGVQGVAIGMVAGVYGSGVPGVHGNGNPGVLGTTIGDYQKAVKGQADSSYAGVGVYGVSNSADGDSYGVQGEANQDNTKSVGGHFFGYTGVEAISWQGSAVIAQGNTVGISASGTIGVDSIGSNYGVYGIANGRGGFGGYFKGNDLYANGLYAEGTGYDSTSGVGGYGIVGKVTGGNAQKAGVYGEASKDGYGIWGYAPVNNPKAGVYGSSGGTSYGVEAKSEGGIGLYSKGKTYAGKFEGQIVADRLIETKKYSVLDTSVLDSKTLGIDKTLTGTKSIFFDSSELFVLANSGSNATLSRFYPLDLQLIKDYNFSNIGTTSNLIAAGVQGVQGVMFWSSTGSVVKYNWLSKSGVQSSVAASSPSSLLNKIVTTGLYVKDGYYVIGTSDGRIYSTNASNLIAYTDSNISAGGSILKFILNGTDLYALVDMSSTNDKIIKMNVTDFKNTPFTSSVQLTYTLPYNTSATKQQTAKSMTFDGHYLWVAMQNNGSGGSNGSLNKVNVFDNIDIQEINTIYGKPNGLVFDGSYIWFNTENYLQRLLPSDSNVSSENKFLANGTIIGDIEFDGTYIWYSTGTSLRRFFSGQGSGSYGQPWAYKGINIMDDNGNVYCVKVSNNGGSLSVPSSSGSCQTLNQY